MPSQNVDYIEDREKSAEPKHRSYGGLHKSWNFSLTSSASSQHTHISHRSLL